MSPVQLPAPPLLLVLLVLLLLDDVLPLLLLDDVPDELGGVLGSLLEHANAKRAIATDKRPI
jgi:hypothetical protein